MSRFCLVSVFGRYYRVAVSVEARALDRAVSALPCEQCGGRSCSHTIDPNPYF